MTDPTIDGAPAMWAVVMPREGRLPTASAECIEEAKRLASSRSTALRVVLVVSDSAIGLAPIAAAQTHGADDVVVLAHADAAAPGQIGVALAEQIRSDQPLAVVFDATARGLDLGQRTATILRRRFADRCVRVEFTDESVRASRVVLGGAQHALEEWAAAPYLVAMVPGAIGVVGEVASGGGEIVPTRWRVDEVSEYEQVTAFKLGDPRRRDLTECDSIVSVGRGLGSGESLPLAEELAEVLAAGIGGSRPVIESGWLPYERQVGQTGRTVSPRLYIACGISGATQHLAGISGADHVIAINSDASAPIFKRADLAVIGDLHELLPAITAALVERKASVEDQQTRRTG